MTAHGSIALSTARHNLQKLSIDPYSYKSHLQISPRTPDSDEVPLTGGHSYHHHNHNHSYSSYEQAIVSDSEIDDMGESITNSTKRRDPYHNQNMDDSEQPAPILCSVLCQHDFDSDDLDHLCFRKNEILDVIKQEETGWWAAMRVEVDSSTGARRDAVGWIPEAYVKVLPEGEAARLRLLRLEVRGYDYAAEEIWRQAPVLTSPSLLDSQHARYSSDASPGLPVTPLPLYTRTDPRLTRAVSQMHLNRSHQASASHDQSRAYREFRSRHRPDKPERPSAQLPSLPSSAQTGQHSRNHARPQAHTFSNSLSDIERPPSRGRADTVPHLNSRSGSSGSLRMPGTNLTNSYRDTDAASRMMAKSASARVSSQSSSRREGSSSGSEAVMQQRRPPTRTNSSRLPGTNARMIGGKPRYFDQIILDSEGRVRVASLDALVEKLIADCSNNERKVEIAEETLFRRVFLTTFRTFTTAEKLFEMLFGIFYSRTMDDSDHDKWQRHQLEARRGVLTILLTWVEDYRFLEEDVLLAQRLKEFLDLVKSPLDSLARKINRRVDKLTFSINSEPSPVTSPVKTRKFIKIPRMDSSKPDPSDVADYLTLIEFSKYRKITPQECFRHTTHSKEAWPNLSAFCETHEKIVQWVKSSILDIEQLKPRGDMIEFWIKIAERCKTLGNFATMSAVITSLSSTVITQLALSWGRVSMHRRPQYDSLLRLIDPTGNFSILRGLLRNHEGPCIPFVLPYLTDLAHINDTYTDEPSDGNGTVQVCFVKRQKWYDVVHTMLKYQSRPYETLSRIETAVEYAERNMKEVDENGRDEKFYWNRSRELMAHESHQHDLLKGLEAAGF